MGRTKTMKYSRRSSKYRQCKECQFWVTSDEPYCPNCNTEISTFLRKFAWLVWFVSLLTTSGLTAKIVSSTFEGWTSVTIGVITGIIVSLVVIVLFSKVIKRIFGKKVFPRRPKSSLRQDEQTIQQRMEDLQRREKPLKSVRQRAEQVMDIQQRQKIENTLNRAMSALHAQRDSYRAKLWEIQMIRWHNTLKPLIDEWNIQNKSEYNYFYQTLLYIRKEGEKILQEWKQNDLATTSGGQQNIRRLKQALVSCDQMYQNIVAQQAAQTVQDISRFESQSQTSYETQANLKDIEIFSTLPDVEAFSSGFTELENEYFRLKSEEEVDNTMNFQ